MAKRGENIYKRKDGRWEGRYIKGRNPSGKAIYCSVYGGSYTDVKQKLFTQKSEHLMLHQHKEYFTFTGTLKDWLLRWLKYDIQPNLRASTYASYRYKMEKYVLPKLGDIKLVKITTNHIKSFIAEMRQSGYSPGTISTIIQILSGALQLALEKNILHSNPCKSITRTHTNKNSVHALTLKEQQKLEKAAFHHDEGIMVALGLYAGLRIGELSALRWTDIDFEAGELHVQQTLQRIASYQGENGPKTQVYIGPPKSKKSQRIIPLGPSLIAYLAHCKAQSSHEYVIQCKHRYVEPRVISYRFSKLLKKANLAPFNFHCLRHTFATRCLEKNIDIVTVSYLMGHSSTKMTLDIYAESIPEHRKKAMEHLGSMLYTAPIENQIHEGSELLKNIKNIDARESNCCFSCNYIK